VGFTHEPWLVALSLIVAIQGAYVGLTLAVSISSANGFQRRIRLAGASLALGVSIWAMHFIGILAARLPLKVDYLVLPTLISFLVCVIVVSVALLVASTDFPLRWKVIAAGVFMGIGIASMHYIGMLALHTQMMMHHDSVYIVLSVVISIAASTLALHNCFGKGRLKSPVLAAVTLGFAISAMHYVAMAGLMIIPLQESSRTSSPAISSDFLAIVVAMVAFFVSGIFFLTLLPDRDAFGTAPAAPERPQPSPVSDPATEAGTRPAKRFHDRLPVQHGGATRMMSIDQVYAVQANGHYSLLFDGTDDHFCSLSISEISERLDPSMFMRVHRSHLINVTHPLSLKKLSDGIVVELAGHMRRTIPISRTQVNILKSYLEKYGAK
jgi:diguanylate cyclase